MQVGFSIGVMKAILAMVRNCTNTRKVTVKLTTSKTTGTDGSLLANTAPSNAAKGVGVLLKWPNNRQIVPNSTSSYTAQDILCGIAAS